MSPAIFAIGIFAAMCLIGIVINTFFPARDNLEEALKKTDKLPESHFGQEQANEGDLPDVAAT